MQKINIAEWVKSALIIDDQWGEVKNLIQILNSNGVSTSYYSPNHKADDLVNTLDMSFLEKLSKREKNAAQKAIKKLLLDTLSYTRIKKLKKGSLTGYNLIFLDIDYKDPISDTHESQVNFALNLLNDALSKESTPYGLILWSKESAFTTRSGKSVFEYVKEILYENKVVSLKDMPKPLFVVDIDKAVFWGRGNYSNLIETINVKLQKDKVAKFFAYWNKEVLQSAAITCKDIQSYAEMLLKDKQNALEKEAHEESCAAGEDKVADEVVIELPTLEKEFFDVLKYTTYQYFGFSRKQENDISDILSRHAFSYMSSQLYDRLHSEFCRKKISQVFSDQVDNIYGQVSNQAIQACEHYTQLRNILKSNKLLSRDLKDSLKSAIEQISLKHKDSVLHSVLAGLNFQSLFGTTKSDLKQIEIPGLIYSKSSVNSSGGTYNTVVDAYINITPPCDAAQGRKNASLYLAGKMFSYGTYAEAQQKYHTKEGERYYKTPSAFNENRYLVFCFDLKDVSRTIKNKRKFQTKFILKASSFTHLMQKFGHHNSRMGELVFN